MVPVSKSYVGIRTSAPAFTEDIKEIDFTLETATADRNHIQDSVVNEVDKIRFDMDTKTEYTEALISTKVLANKLEVPRPRISFPAFFYTFLPIG
jgi:hypothetical protein